MKLLLDENLSRRIVPFLQNGYMGSTQVALVGMEHASDTELWEYAKKNSFVIVTKDSDFYDMSLLHGALPRVIWLKIDVKGSGSLILGGDRNLKELYDEKSTSLPLDF